MILFFPPLEAAETRKGLRPLPGPFPGRWDGGRGSPVGCPLLLRVPAVRLAAERHCRRKGRCGGGTEDGRGRFAARRGTKDGGPRSAACFCWKRQRSGSPRGGFGGGDFHFDFADFGDFGAGFVLAERKNSSPHAFPPPFRGLCPAAGRHPQTSQILGHFPGGILRRGCAIFPAAPEIGDKLWNRLPRRNRPSSSSRAL